MKTGKKIIYGFIISVIAIAVIVFAHQTQPVQAVRNGEMNFGMISFNAGQTVRFNIVNPNNSVSRLPRRVTLAFDIYSLGGPDTCSDPANDDKTVAACTNNLRFVRRESSEITLLPGEAASLDFTAASTRISVNAVMLGGPDTIGDPTLVPTLEIREAGRTLFIHPGVIRGFNPQPDPPLTER